jgi:hypothetical protein
MNKAMKQVIQQAVTDALLPHGFERSGANWTRSLDDTVHVVNLQRSKWSEAYYINVAVWVKSLGNPPAALKENKCHIRQRLGGPQLEKALKADEAMDDRKRASIVGQAISRRGLPFLESCSTLDSVNAAVKAAN